MCAYFLVQIVSACISWYQSLVDSVVMPPRRRQNVPNARENPLEEIYEREEVAQLRQQVEVLTQQLAAMAQRQGTPNPPNAEEESSDEENPFAPFQPQHRRAGFDETRRWESGLKIDILEFHGGLQPEEFFDWVNAVEEVLEFKQVPEDRRVSLIATRLRGRAGAWWQ